jgi:hypothetical protein
MSTVVRTGINITCLNAIIINSVQISEIGVSVNPYLLNNDIRVVIIDECHVNRFFPCANEFNPVYTY